MTEFFQLQSQRFNSVTTILESSSLRHALLMYSNFMIFCLSINDSINQLVFAAHLFWVDKHYYEHYYN